MRRKNWFAFFKNALMSILLPRALECGGYKKIPHKEVIATARLVLVATIIIQGLETITVRQ